MARPVNDWINRRLKTARTAGMGIGRKLPLSQRASKAATPEDDSKSAWWKFTRVPLSQLWKEIRKPKDGDPDQDNLLDSVRNRKKNEEKEEVDEERKEYDEIVLEKLKEQVDQASAKEDADEDLEIKKLKQKEQVILKDTRSSIYYLIALIVAIVEDIMDFTPLEAIPIAGPIAGLVLDLAGIGAYWVLLGGEQSKTLRHMIMVEMVSDLIGAFFPPAELATEVVGMVTLQTLVVLGLWGKAGAAHREAAMIHKEKKEYQEKIKKAQAKKTGKTYREPSPKGTLILIILTGLVVAGILTKTLADFTSIMVFAGPILVLWIILGLLGKISFDQDLAITIGRFLLVVGCIVFALFFILPAIVGCARSGECKALFKEGVITASIATQENPFFYYLNPAHWYKIWQSQLEKAGFQPEGQAETQKVGIRITKMDTRLPSGGVFHEGDPVTVYIHLLSTLYYPVTIQHSCTLSASTGAAGLSVMGPADSVDPETTDLYETKEQTVTCTWNNLKKNTYKATYTGSMISTTNAFVTLTFIERQSMESFRAHEPDVDLNKFLFIDPVFKPLYTNGPITVQIDRITQPMALDMDKPRTFSLNFFLESNWTDGMIQHADQFTLYVPKEIQLQQKPGCDGFDEIETSPIQDYTMYTAPYNKLGRATETLRRLTCEFSIPNTKELLGDKPKALKTIAMQIDYKYKIQRSIPFTVRT